MPVIDAFSWNLLLATAGVAATHTLFGPDHYLPFILLARARGWSRLRAVSVTAACGLGHILSSLLLGAVGLAAGSALSRIEKLEGMRGDWAAWSLFGFGLAYLAWGIRRAVRRRRGIAAHSHGPQVHIHPRGDRPHVHAGGGPGEAGDLSGGAEGRARNPAPSPVAPPEETQAGRSTITFWSLFIIFVLGPCEPLIPLFVLPASRGRWDLALATGLLFGLITIALMVAVVLFALAGLERLPFGRLERWSHAMAGAVIALSGAAVLFLGL